MEKWHADNSNTSSESLSTFPMTTHAQEAFLSVSLALTWPLKYEVEGICPVNLEVKLSKELCGLETKLRHS